MNHELSVRDLLDMPNPTWAISEVLPSDGLGLILGPLGAGQSLVALDMACRASLGWPWHGRKTHAGKWVYVCGESDLGAHNLVLRVQAWAQRNGEFPDLGFLPEFVLTEDLDAIIGARRTDPPKAIVIDLGPRLVGLGTADMNEFVSILNRLKRELGCAIVVVASESGQHRRGQGSSSLIGAVDVAIRVEPVGSEPVMLLRWIKSRNIKSRNADSFEEIGVERQVVSVLDGDGREELDEDGQPITSCVIVPTSKERLREARAIAPE